MGQVDDVSSGRCGWCGADPLYVDYHDHEWGRPVRDSQTLFAKLCLDGFQAGLSWITILRKRPAFEAAFAGFDPVQLAEWGEPEVRALLDNAGIVRHRGKIEATLSNARAWLRIDQGRGLFSDFVWSAVGDAPVLNRFSRLDQVPATDPRTDKLSAELKAAGFRFCGPTIVYAFAQATGLFNDHLISCPTYDECVAL